LAKYNIEDGKIEFDMDLCGGCQTCEIACSFKHTGQFNHLVSSIEIIELKNKPGYGVCIYLKNSGERIKCDGCIDVDGDPLCVQYCHKPEDLKKMIDEVVKIQKESEEL